MKNQETKNYFIDTEFHEHKKPVKFLGITIAKVWTIDLISIGIVCEDGREYYAMNRDLNLKHAKKNKWLNDNVLSKLPEKQPLYPPYGSPRIWQESMRWLPMEQIRQEVIDFCGGKPDWDESGSFYTYANGTPIFYGYYADYDWVVFCWLFGTMMDLPNGFPMFCKDLKQMLDDKLNDFQITLGEVEEWDKTEKDREATFDEKLKWLKKQPNYPTQKNEHNALDDAKFDINGKSAKECFYLHDSTGKIVPTLEPELLYSLYKCKGSINFHIKMWAESRGKFEMGSAEFSIEGKKKEKKDFEKYGLVFNDYKTIQEEYELLDWMIYAVEKQKYQYYICIIK